MTTVDDVTTPIDALPPGQRIAAKPFKRFLLGQTAYDFWGRRWLGFGISLALIVISVITLSINWLNLGIDFEGGIAYDVPATEGFGTDDARDVLDAAGLDGGDAKVEQRRSSSGTIIKIQIEDEPAEVRDAVQVALAEAAGVADVEVSVSSVSASWGEEITRKAVTALIVFLGLIAIVIAIRFEWRMAVSAILAMLHDVVISAGIYSLFGFEVTPPTLIAFLTILGYSLYDTIVVFDRVRENQRRITSAGLTAADLVNVSTNQVLLRSLNTSIAAILPVMSLLLVGAGLLGQATLQEFALALLIGMLTGAYSSIFVATPILGWLKGARAAAGAPTWLVGDDLRLVVVRGVGVLAPRPGRRRGRPTDQRRREPDDTAPASEIGAPSAGPPRPGLEASTEQLLSHPPRPRKKKRH